MKQKVIPVLKKFKSIAVVFLVQRMFMLFFLNKLNVIDLFSILKHQWKVIYSGLFPSRKKVNTGFSNFFVETNTAFHKFDLEKACIWSTFDPLLEKRPINLVRAPHHHGTHVILADLSHRTVRVLFTFRRNTHTCIEVTCCIGTNATAQITRHTFDTSIHHIT